MAMESTFEVASISDKMEATSKVDSIAVLLFQPNTPFKEFDFFGL